MIRLILLAYIWTSTNDYRPINFAAHNTTNVKQVVRMRPSGARLTSRNIFSTVVSYTTNCTQNLDFIFAHPLLSLAFSKMRI